jgi:hypothetical protein
MADDPDRAVDLGSQNEMRRGAPSILKNNT